MVLPTSGFRLTREPATQFSSPLASYAWQGFERRKLLSILPVQ